MSDFSHEIINLDNSKTIVIIDLDLGRRSVTNDIENVVRSIEISEKIDANDCVIVYKDSENSWDGWDNKSQQFIGLGCKDHDSAINKMINR